MKQIEYEPQVFEELNKKLNDIAEFCLMNRIPIFMLYAREENGTTKYVNNVITPINVNVHLSDDRITKYNASLNENFQLKIKRNNPATYAGDVFDSIL